MNLLQYLTPVNLTEERGKFFASDTYQPQFAYVWENNEAKLWAENHNVYASLIRALRLQDSALIRDAASALFDTQVDMEVLEKAKAIIRKPPEKQPPFLIDDVVTAFVAAFWELGLDEYRIEVTDERGFNFRPKALEHSILVSRHMALDFFSIDGEVKHELAHIIRHENGMHNSISASKGYLATEEGLASYCQDFVGANGHSSLFQHAAEYVVTGMSLQRSLREVVDYLISIGFSKELAWQRASRHKYGFIDTSQPGDIMKPSMYYFHEQKVAEIDDEERYRLFVGKIRLDELDLFPHYQGRIPLQTLKSFYRWKNDA